MTVTRIGMTAVVLGVLVALLTPIAPNPSNELPVALRATLNGASMALVVWLWGGLLADAIRWIQRRR